MRTLSNLTKTVSPSLIRQMYNYSGEMSDVVSFTVGEPDFNTPKFIVDAAVDALYKGAHHYTPNAGIPALRKAVGNHISEKDNIQYDPESEIVITAGGMEALFLLMQVLFNPGDEIILSDPCWTNYPHQALLCHAVPKFVEVSASNNFQFEPGSLESAITERTKAILINSPSNPTGGVADRETLFHIAQIAIKHDLYVISDEVYRNLLYNGIVASSIASIPGMRERTIIVNSFSKTYAMTGWRVGFALGPFEVIKNMVKFQENIVACVNTAAQYGAIAALEGTQEPLHEMQKSYTQRREIMVSGISKIKGLHCFAPQGAFYVFVDISSTKMNSMDFAVDLLKKGKVVVVPGCAFGKKGNNYIRLSFATTLENIEEGIRRISDYMEGIGNENN